MSRKPEVWRAQSDMNGIGSYRVAAHNELTMFTNAIVVEDGAVMPLDAATERLVEAVQFIVRDGLLLPELSGTHCELSKRLAAFDAERKEVK